MGHQKGLLAALHPAEKGQHGLRLGGIQVKAIQDQQNLFLSLQGQGAAQGQPPDLLVDLLMVVPGVGPMGHTAAHPDGRTGATLPSPSGVLLPPGLSAAAPDLAAVLGVVGPQPAVGQMGHHDLVHGGRVDGGGKHRVGEFEFPDHVALKVDLLDPRHVCSSLPYSAVFRMRTRPSFAPGTAPRRRIRLFSTSTANTRRFFTVTRSPPMRPGIVFPLKMCPG